MRCELRMSTRRRWVRGMHMAAIDRLFFHLFTNPNDWQAVGRLRNHLNFLQHWQHSPYYEASAGLHEPLPDLYSRAACTVRASS